MTNDQTVTQADREAARFWNKVDRRGADECWPWIGSKNDRGYGSLYHRNRLTKATHVSYEMHNGHPFPSGMVARHSCENPACVNPRHIIPGTSRENAQDMVDRKRHHANRRTHCIHGHPLSGDNLYVRPNGQRACRECKRRQNIIDKRKRRKVKR